MNENKKEITTIQITQDLRKRLSRLGYIGDSYQQVIEMLLDEYEKKRH
jgi:Fe2+ transport system protein FeoA